MRVKLEKGGPRCGSGQKRGVFTAAHTHTEHIYVSTPLPPGLRVYHNGCVSSIAVHTSHVFYGKSTGTYKAFEYLYDTRFQDHLTHISSRALSIKPVGVKNTFSCLFS